jgi:hypothetical protein
MRADPILSELASLVKQFDRVSKQNAKDRDSILRDKYGKEEYTE